MRAGKCSAVAAAAMFAATLLARADDKPPNAPRAFPAKIPLEKPNDRPLSAAMARMYDVWNPLEGRGNEPFSNCKFSRVEGLSRKPNVSRHDPTKVLKIGDTYYVWYTCRRTQAPPAGPQQATDTVSSVDWDLAAIWRATSREGKQISSSDAATAKIRIFVESDLPGGDPDDEATMTRFFLYLNEFDVEGVIGTRNASRSRTGKDGRATILQFIDAYEDVYDNLKIHDPDYPTPTYLRSIAKQCHTGTEARDLLIKAVDKEDGRPVVVSNWGTNEGNKSSARQALDHVKQTRSDAEYRAFARKIIMCEGGGQRACYQLQNHYRYFHRVIDTFQPDRWYHRWRPITERAGGFDISADVKRGHGPLGERYTTQKEGDTPCFMHCLPTGLVRVDRPYFGSWAGRFGFDQRAHKYMANQEDIFSGSTSRDNTLRRWAEHIQNDFAARADWCVNSFSEANHPPAPVVNDDKTLDIVSIEGTANEEITLSAAGSTDPDGDKMRYEWVYYAEPGTYRGKVSLSSKAAKTVSFHVPSDFAKGDSIHVVLIVTDAGKPALTRYRRIVVCAP